MPERERIGFLGLGIMGSRMAANVRRAGLELTVWTHTEGKAKRWAEEHGARAVDTPAAVAGESDIVISMVVDGSQVAAVLLGDRGVLEGLAAGGERSEPLLCIDMSTIAPADTRRIGAELAAHGASMLDAPVTGSSPRAANGTLTIMVGGEQADFARAEPVLASMGSKIVHVGELGQGEMLKLINNGLAAANAAALAEGLLLASVSGIEPDAFREVLESGSAASAQLSGKAQAMLTHDFTPLFKTEHMLKDVRMCLAEASAAGVPLPAIAHANDLLVAAIGRGHGQEDYASLIESAEGLAARRI